MKRKSITILMAILMVFVGCTKTKKYPIPLFEGTPGAEEGAASTGTLNTVEDAQLTSISITPYENTIAQNTFVELVATGIYSNGGHKDLTNTATWTISDSTIGESQGKGVIKGITAGSAIVSASFEGITGSANLTVTNATLTTIQVTYVDPIPGGTTTQYKAIGVFSDGTTQDLTNYVEWSSDNSNVTISNNDENKGEATANTAGTSTITATFGSTSGSSELQVTGTTVVSIAIVADQSSIAAGTSTQFRAIATLSDGSTVDVTEIADWSSSAKDIANVYNSGNQKGLALGLAPGSSTFTVNYGGASATYDLTITSATLTAISIGGNISIAKGTSHQFTAIGTFSDGTTQDITNIVTWTTSDETIGSISNAANSEGYASANGEGSVTITASVSGTEGSAISTNVNLTVTAAALTSISVSPTGPDVAKGLYQNFTATGTYTDGTTQDITSLVTWSSSNTSQAIISNEAGTNGKTYAKGVGSPSITATLGSVSGSSTLNVTAATLVSLSVTPLSPSVAKGNQQQFIATGVYTDNSTVDVTDIASWSSASTITATINATDGLATAIAEGSSVITATLNGQTANSTMTVTGAVLTSIAIDQTNPSLAKGTNTNLTATATFSDGTTQNITDFANWTSSDTSIATISTTGLATTGSEGDTTISITYNGQTASTTLTTTAAALVSIQVTPASASIAKGYSQQYAATGIYTDGTNQDITASVTWNSSAPSKATISNAAGSNGKATTVDVGSTEIEATSGTITSNTANLTVTSAVLVSLQMDQGNTSIAKGSSTNFTVTGIYSDGTSQDLTETVSWSSSATNIAQVDNSAGTKGNTSTYPTGQGETGISTITASYDGQDASVTLTVTAATLSTITIAPGNASIAKGRTQDYTATGTYTDGSTQNITSAVTWNSANTSIVEISNGTNKGRATAADVGSSTITASLGIVSSNSATLEVTAATLVSLAINQGDDSISKGSSKSYTVTGTYTDDSTQNLTDSVTWESTDTNIVTISNANGSEGSATADSVGGPVNITASLDSVTSPAVTLTVTPATLVSISIGGDASINVGGLKFYTATGTYSDGTTQDITDAVTWTTSASSVVSISNASDDAGKATANAAGTSTISATLSGVTGSGILTVNEGSGSGSSVSAVGSNNVTVPSDVTIGTTPTGDFEGITYFKEPNLSGFVASTPDYSTTDCSGYGSHLLGLVSGTSIVDTMTQVSSYTKTSTDGCSAVYNLQITTDSNMKVTEVSNAFIEAIGIQIINGSVDNLPTPQGSETDSKEFRVVIQANYSSGGTETVGVGVSTESDYDSNEAILTNFLDGTNIVNIPADAVTTDSFTGAADPQADFVWVIDNSGSMKNAQAAVSNAAATFFDKLGDKHLDYRLTAITTDSSTLRSGWTTSQTTFESQVKPGTKGSGTEAGIHYGNIVANNSSNFRSGAKVVFIMVSDEADHYECKNGGKRSSDPQNDVPPCDGGSSYDMTDNVFKNNGYKVYSLIGLDSSGNPSACTGDNAKAINNSGWPAYKNLATTTGGFATSICSSNFESAMNSMVSSVAASSSSYVLSKTPISSTLVVKVNGATIAKDSSNGWVYDASSNSIIFSGTAYPAEGASISVTYETATGYFAALSNGGNNQLMAYLSAATGSQLFKIALVTLLATFFILAGRAFINRRNA